MAYLREHDEQLGRVGCALCCLQLCQHQMQTAQIALGMLPQSLICHWQWRQQRLRMRCSHQVLEVVHDISWWLARLVYLGSSCEMLLFSVAALHKSTSLTQDVTPLAGIGKK